MIISRTPFRISFFGGGTDYPAWYRQHGGAVLATTINKYCYISCRYLPPFFEHKSRIVWSHIERVKTHGEIEHPAVRAGLQFLELEDGLELHHDGDLPARTGLGSSSAFTVGLLHALHGLKGRRVSKKQLAREAIYVEQELLKEHVGCQDQVLAAYGGFSRVEFLANDEFRVSPVPLSAARRQLLQDHLVLFFTGISRTASDIAKAQIEATRAGARERQLRQMHEQVDRAMEILQGEGSIAGFGDLLDEAWQLKRSLTEQISTSYIDELYARARRAGAIGGKLLGAGGGGFLLLFAASERHEAVRRSLDGLLQVPFQFEQDGSQIIFYEPDGSAAAVPAPVTAGKQPKVANV